MSPSRPARLLIAVAAFGAAAAGARAVDVYDGVRAPPGLYFLSYTALYAAEERTDAGGDAAAHDTGLRSVSQTLRLSWYRGAAMWTVLAPVSYLEADSPDEARAGWGDVTLAGGGFLPPRSVDLLALLAVDAPVGRYDEDRRLNPGSHQWNVRPSLFLHKSAGPCTFDAVVKRNFRFENPDTDVKPGDEWIAEALATRQFGGVKLGPSVAWLEGGDREEDGERAGGTGRRVVSAGAQAWFKAGAWSVVLNYMGDAYVENGTRGHLARLKLVRKL